MTLRFTILEKCISLALIIWGGLELYVACINIEYLYQLLLKSGKLDWDKISLVKVFVNFHLSFLFPILSILGGTFLLFSKRIGWIMSLIVSSLHTVLMLIPADKSEERLESNPDTLMVVIAISVVFILLFLTLLHKQFRVKYLPSTGTFWIIGAVTILITLDKVIIYLMK